MRKTLPAWLLAWALFAAPGVAHERWVMHELLDPNFDRSLFTSFTPLNTAVLIGVALVVAALWVISKKIEPKNLVPGTRSQKARDLATLFLGVSYGATCVITSFSGEYLAPDLIGAGVMGSILVWGTAGFGLLLFLGLFTRLACIGTIVLFILAVALRPFADFDGQSVPSYAVFNYVDIVGIALFMAVVGRGRFSLDAWWQSKRENQTQAPAQHETAAGLLRLLMGLTLVVLGCQKFLIPELPMGVIQNYADQIFEPMNRLTGVTEEQYVFAAATVEFSVGLLLILGLFTRLLMLVLAGMFTTTLFIFKGELIGHLPLFGIVVALFIAGGGRFRVGMPQLGRGLPASAMLLLVIMLPGLGACGNSTVQGATLPDTAPLSQDGKLLTVRLQSGAYTFDLRFERPVISQLFSIETTVTKTATGELLNSGLLRVNASMPEHGHGMQTEPRTKRISQGIYSTAGMKMHMNGSWELSAKIEIDGDYEHAIGRFDFGPPIRPIAPITK